MEVSVLARPGFRLVGIEGVGPTDSGPNWIPSLWEEANRRFPEVRDIIVPGTAWGFMSDVDEFLGAWSTDGQGKYLAGWELIEGKNAPEGWSVWEIPEKTYAIVKCTYDRYEDAYAHVVKEFLPSSSYEMTGAQHEVYPPEFKDISADEFYLYFIVEEL